MSVQSTVYRAQYYIANSETQQCSSWVVPRQGGMCSILQFTRIYWFNYPHCICTAVYRIGFSPSLFYYDTLDVDELG